MTGNKYLTNNAGQLTEVAAIQSSAGAGDAGKIPAVDSTGRLDTTFMPVGYAAETQSIVCSENLSAGNLINVYNNAGTPNCRRADASNGYVAQGFVLSSYTTGQTATVYFEGSITGLTSLTPGTRMFVSATPGAATATAPSTSAYIVQEIGYAVATTVIKFAPQQSIILA